MIARIGALLAAVCLVFCIAGAPTAAAVPEPHVDPAVDIPPPDSKPSPEVGMRLNVSSCAQSAVLADSQFNSIPAQAVFNVSELHNYARGDGQVVAVIDSGVQKVTRLPQLRGGGDYIMGGDGLEDCDHHGTLVAGIIGAAPSDTDAFVGVAPGAEILSIRQTSEAFTEDSPPPGFSNLDRSRISMSYLSRSIVHAADSNATVINMSLTACLDAGSPADVRELAGALNYAVNVKNVVVVAAAGNVGSGNCQLNPGYDPANPRDKRNWAGVQSISLPSYFKSLVLSVAGTDLTGSPYVNTMPGPWVGVAAPAMNIVSLDPTEPTLGALTNATFVKGKPVPLNGTSFATAYVSGLAALIREKHPKLSAHQVINRIIATAHTPPNGLNNTLGAGIVDPVAALTETKIPDGDYFDPAFPSMKAPTPPPSEAPDTGKHDAALYAGIAIVAMLVVISLVVFASRKPGPGNNE
ncbi:type VII secretion-associated serine protease mycosin [Mycobacteroides abscessus subsp. bolletii]|uniref:type VII secretion-associated serine protease mycosin n=1 Tax=Mycobacteroides abscessus TaxID=36809 RepID=UPI0009A90258|nr:type VII secretion-associated serine protease mycosin [Mycobacteroides abscessus]SKU95136.1 type VII secretion-associated serine protease mycosin [Mycobacteroides abscessus subsp. bolletii]